MGGGRYSYTCMGTNVYSDFSTFGIPYFPAGIINQDMLAVAGLSHFL